MHARMYACMRASILPPCFKKVEGWGRLLIIYKIPNARLSSGLSMFFRRSPALSGWVPRSQRLMGGPGEVSSSRAEWPGQAWCGADPNKAKPDQTQEQCQLSCRLHIRSSRAVCLVYLGYCILSQVTQVCDQWTKKTEGYSARDKTEVGSCLKLRNSSSQWDAVEKFEVENRESEMDVTIISLFIVLLTFLLWLWRHYEINPIKNHLAVNYLVDISASNVFLLSK